MAASTTFFDESDECGGSHSGIARQNRLSETRLFVEDLVGCLLDDPNNLSLIRSRINSQPPMNSQTRSVLVNMLVERLNGDSGPIVAATVSQSQPPSGPIVAATVSQSQPPSGPIVAATVSQSQPPHANAAPTGSVSDLLAWLMGSLVVSSFGNDNLAKSLDIVTETLLKKNSDAKYVMAANVVALIAKVALAFGLFFGMWLGHVWAFNKTGCARRASQVFLWAGTSLAPLALFATLISLVLVNCSYFNN